MPDDDRLSHRGAGILHRLRHDERGITMIEALVAAIVLMLGLLPTVKVFNDSRDQNATGERNEIALLQAEQALEEMRGLPYDRLMLSAGAVDPGGGRITGAGANFRVRSDLTEPLVYATTEGQPVGNAWVDPVSHVTTGSDDAPVDMTIYRFITWRDEECRVADLSKLGLTLPTAIDGAQAPLDTLLNNLLGPVINLFNGTTKTTLQTLQTRLAALRTSLATYESQISNGVNGLSQLDLCDLSSSALTSLQQLGRLTPGLSAAGALNARLTTLQNALSQNLCLPVVGCVLGQVQTTAISGVNQQLDCLFGAGSGSAAFNSYLGGVANGLTGLAGDVSNTKKNTKRIAVAVVIEPRGGAGPFEPVWASSVVRDPAAGLLASAGASCG